MVIDATGVKEILVENGMLYDIMSKHIMD